MTCSCWCYALQKRQLCSGGFSILSCHWLCSLCIPSLQLLAVLVPPALSAGLPVHLRCLSYWARTEFAKAVAWERLSQPAVMFFICYIHFYFMEKNPRSSKADSVFPQRQQSLALKWGEWLIPLNVILRGSSLGCTAALLVLPFKAFPFKPGFVSSFLACTLFYSSSCSAAKAVCETGESHKILILRLLVETICWRIASGQIWSCSAIFNRQNCIVLLISFILLSAGGNKEAGEA